MALKTDSENTDIAAIKQVLRKQLSLSWGRDKDADWDAFSDTFHPAAALIPGARPAQPQSLSQFIERMRRLRIDGKLETFEVTPLGCDVRVFGNVAVAFAACRMLENESVENREVNATVLVRDNGSWRIAAQAWDLETDLQKFPDDLARPDDA